MRRLKGEPEVIVYSVDPLIDENDINVDVEVRLSDGTRWSATVFTVDNLRSLLARHRTTGKDGAGLYAWASDMVVVDRVSDASLRQLVDRLIAQDELPQAFKPLHPISD